MLALLRRWADCGDAELLAQPTNRVYSRGDANLLNWLHDGETTYVVDFEFSGFSDAAVDAADHIEHISARGIPDEILGRRRGQPRRHISQPDPVHRRTANHRARWLAVLWKQRAQRVEEFTVQRERVHALLG